MENQMELFKEDAKVTMSSREIAELTGKQHKDVLEAIRHMEPAWEKVNGRKFPLVEYVDAKGERRPMYQLSKTECLYVATKFNDEARAKLVIRWEQLELEKQQVRPLSTLDFLKLALTAMEEQKAELEGQKRELEEVRKEVKMLDAKTTTRPDYFTVAGYAKNRRLKISPEEAVVIGKQASKYCRENNMSIGAVADTRFGTVGSYPSEVLERVCEKVLG